MTTIGTHGLTCLVDEDYAAIALHMQGTAQTIEANLLAQQASLTAYTNRTSIVFTSTVTSSFAAGSGTVMPDGRVANATSFVGATVNGGGLSGYTISSSSVTFTVPRSGWYDMGGYCNVIPAGAITAASERLIYMQVRQVPEPSTGNALTTYQERVVDTNTGGEYLNVAGLVYLIADRTATLAQYVSHANVASNMVTQIGAKMWLAFMGPRGGVVVNA